MIKTNKCECISVITCKLQILNNTTTWALICYLFQVKNFIIVRINYFIVISISFIKIVFYAEIKCCHNQKWERKSLLIVAVERRVKMTSYTTIFYHCSLCFSVFRKFDATRVKRECECDILRELDLHYLEFRSSLPLIHIEFLSGVGRIFKKMPHAIEFQVVSMEIKKVLFDFKQRFDKSNCEPFLTVILSHDFDATHRKLTDESITKQNNRILSKIINYMSYLHFTIYKEYNIFWYVLVFVIVQPVQCHS